MRITFAAMLAPLLAASLIPGPALAQAEPRTLAVTSTAAWQHAETRMILPPRVGGLARSDIRDNSKTELDVFATYIDRDEGIVALVYIYRTMTPDVPLWFDRALATIMLPQAGVAPPAITGFVRPGASAASGLRAAMTDNVSGMRSTAVAIAPLGSWLVKIRLGSTRLDPAALDARLSAFAAALGWPAQTGTARAAIPVEPCPTPLRLRTARTVSSRTDVVVNWVAWVDPPERSSGPSRVYCREPGATIERGVYRLNGATDSYLIALNDAGVALAAGEETDLARLVGERGHRRRYSLTLVERNSVAGHTSFDRLPPPDQALALVRGGQPLAATTGGRERR